VLVPDETSTFYLSYRSGGQVNIDLWLQNDVALIEVLEGENLLKGAYYGGMLALILYNLFLFLVIRDGNYLRYVIYTGVYALLQVSYNGVAFEYFWPDSPAWGNLSLNMIVCATNLTMMNFARHFLETASYQPRLNSLGRGLEFINLGLLVAAPMLSYQFISQSALVLALLGVTLILAMSIMALATGFKPARYFLSAWIMLLVGVAAAVLKGFGILPHNFFTEYGFQIGSYVEITLLSMALADRMQQLKLASITDMLTNVFNRRHFNNRFQISFDQIRGRSGFLSLAILDIDHFKQFNDRYGHETGDRALIAVSKAIQGALRDSDELYRYGGEEFIVLLPNTNATHASQIAERIRSTVNAFEIEGERLSISLGITTFDGQNFANPQEMLAKADNALYSAKAQGRNCTVHSQDLAAI
jgi:diguanylate cyclase (GGDEF)-like protein